MAVQMDGVRDAMSRAVSLYPQGQASQNLRAEKTHDFVLNYQDRPLVVGRSLFLLLELTGCNTG